MQISIEAAEAAAVRKRERRVDVDRTSEAVAINSAVGWEKGRDDGQRRNTYLAASTMELKKKVPDGMISSCSSCSPYSWNYVAEGGKHVLFAPLAVQYENDDRDETFARHNNKTKGKKAASPYRASCRMCNVGRDSGTENVLLRVRKEDLRKSRYGSTHGTADTLDHNHVSSASRSLFFIKNVVAPYLESYVDVPEPVELSTSFLAGLYDNALASGKIPPSRLKDWTLLESPNKEVKNQLSTKSIGTIVKDYRSTTMMCESDNQEDPQDPHQQDHSVLPVVIEFKPKAGYMALTPFVLPQRRHLKYKQSRFVSLQQLQQRGLWTKGWSPSDASRNACSNCTSATSEATTSNSLTTSNHSQTANASGPIRMSLYDPIKFFQQVVPGAQKATAKYPSGPPRPPPQHHNIETTSARATYTTSVTHLEEAISCLLDNPQNNLKCFVGDADILSEGREDEKRAGEHRQLLSSIFGTSGSSSAHRNVNSIKLNNEVKPILQKHPNTTNDRLRDILVQVFTSRDGVDLVSRIHRWQSDLDILDVDGALLVYDRLVEVLKQRHQEDIGDIHSRAQDLIDSITESDLKERIGSEREYDKTSDYPSLLSSSPFKFDTCQEKGSKLIDDLLNEVESFREAIATSYPELPSEDVMDSTHHKCLDIVRNLSTDECRFLLQNWLLSLVMCDISIFVLLQRTATPKTAAIKSNKKMIYVESLNGVCNLSFQLRVVDMDQKPSSKILGKREKEKAFD